MVPWEPSRVKNRPPTDRWGSRHGVEVAGKIGFPKPPRMHLLATKSCWHQFRPGESQMWVGFGVFRVHCAGWMRMSLSSSSFVGGRGACYPVGARCHPTARDQLVVGFWVSRGANRATIITRGGTARISQLCTTDLGAFKSVAKPIHPSC